MAPNAQNTQQTETEIGAEKLRTVHRALRRSLQGIIDTAPQVVHSQQKEFVLYCDNFCEFLHHHHAFEDEMLFPALAGPCGVEEAVARLEAEHNEIDPLMAAFQAAFRQPEFDGKAVARTAAALQAHLIPHLDFEESIFNADTFARADQKLFKDTFDRIEAASQKTGPFTQLPFFVNNLTKEEAQLMVFGSAPWFVGKLLFPLLFNRAHKKVWQQFASRPGRVPATGRA